MSHALSARSEKCRLHQGQPAWWGIRLGAARADDRCAYFPRILVYLKVHVMTGQ